MQLFVYAFLRCRPRGRLLQRMASRSGRPEHRAPPELVS